jgi:hypothetical protein
VTEVRTRFLRSGDAFGSGGRMQTCIYVEADTCRFLLDCGASSLIAMRRFGVDPLLGDAILLTHLHGDHFGGLPFFVLGRSADLEAEGPTRDRRTPRPRTQGSGGHGGDVPRLLGDPATYPASSLAEQGAPSGRGDRHGCIPPPEEPGSWWSPSCSLLLFGGGSASRLDDAFAAIADAIEANTDFPAIERLAGV